jgi:ribosome biogenesis GTPase A
LDELEKITTRAEKLHTEVLVPLNKKWLGPLDKNHDQLTKLPFVFILGNHSSGKSSFINYVLGRRVQVTGVAPTDDGFTVIAPGTADSDQDG